MTAPVTILVKALLVVRRRMPLLLAIAVPTIASCLLWGRLRAGVHGNVELRGHLPALGLIGALFGSLWCLWTSNWDRILF